MQEAPDGSVERLTFDIREQSILETSEVIDQFGDTDIRETRELTVDPESSLLFPAVRPWPDRRLGGSCRFGFCFHEAWELTTNPSPIGCTCLLYTSPSPRD